MQFLSSVKLTETAEIENLFKLQIFEVYKFIKAYNLETSSPSVLTPKRVLNYVWNSQIDPAVAPYWIVRGLTTSYYASPITTIPGHIPYGNHSELWMKRYDGESQIYWHITPNGDQ